MLFKYFVNSVLFYIQAPSPPFCMQCEVLALAFLLKTCLNEVQLCRNNQNFDGANLNSPLKFYRKCEEISDGVSLKTPRPRGWVRAGRPSGGESSFNKRNMYQYPHVSQLFILTSVAKPGIPGAIKNGWVCTADYRMLLGTAVRPVPARMPYISRLCYVGATDVKRWWWWWWWWMAALLHPTLPINLLLFHCYIFMWKDL